MKGLVGANGAGKSTLMKIASAVYTPDEGRIFVGGKPGVFHKPIHAYRAGISVVHQETSLVPTATVVENVFLGRERLRGAVLDEKRMLEEYAVLANRFGLGIPATTKARDLGAAQKKLVEIVKAVARDSRIIIMDEPSDALSRKEAEALFSVVRELKGRGVGIVFITHFLEEVASVCDCATVMRDGRVVASRVSAQLPVADLVSYMLGHASASRKAVVSKPAGAVTLRVKNLSRRREFDGITFDLHEGEVLGVAGVLGSGKTELAKALCGASRPHQGQLELKARPLKARTPAEAARRGIGMAPEDRKATGLVAEHTVRQNISLSSMAAVSRFGFVNRGLERKRCTGIASRLEIAYSGLEQRIKFLSGGNQQKCVLARLILAAPDIMILDEPTRGIDVGAKEEIYSIVRSLAGEGKSIVYCSGDPEEVLAVADRVLVMQKGRLKRTFNTVVSSDELLQEMIEVNDEC